MTTAQTTDKKLHAKLIEQAAEYLRNEGVTRILTEPNATKYGAKGEELPDVFGSRGYHTVVIECKASHADFKADQRKPSRRGVSRGIGVHRLYCCPEYLIESHEVPEGWGLLYATAEGLREVIAPHVHGYSQRDLLEESILRDFGWAMAERYGGNAEKRRNGSSRGGSTLSMPEHVQAQVRECLKKYKGARAKFIIQEVPAIEKCRGNLAAETYFERVVEQGGVKGFGPRNKRRPLEYVLQ
jgi:hypothetical protein